MAQYTVTPGLQVFSAAPEVAPEPPYLTSIDVPATSLEVRPTSPELPALSISDTPEPLTLKSAGELAEIYGVSDKSIQSWYKVVLLAYPWIDPLQLQVGASNKLRYTSLCQKLLADFRNSGLSKDQWIASVHASNPDKLHSPTPAPAPASELSDPFASEPPSLPPIGRLSLPTIHSVGSTVIPAGESLPTDTPEAQTLAATGKLAIEQNSQDLEQIRTLLQQVNSFVDSKIAQLDQETEATQQQVQELKDLAFQLEVKQETLRRAEIRNAAVREESEAAKSAATSKVVSLSDFFAKKSAPQSGS
ncbi:hypothetical protein NDI45_25210 [Leptolyngbya sp. GB1-A1]|uniref:hypothetical protein n=1 Tax=Leptolyngbya sp. GB1-A1 TaxID=2933908 RepID=UPI00329734CE